MTVEAPLPSPCTLVCTLDARTEICLGCGRTLDEIGEWSEATTDRQGQIVADAAARLGRITPRRMRA